MTCRGFSPRKAPGAGRGRARRLPGGLAVAGAVAYRSAMSRVQSLLWVSVIALSSALVAGCGHHRPVVDPALSPALEAQASGQASASMPGAQRVEPPHRRRLRPRRRGRLHGPARCGPLLSTSSATRRIRRWRGSRSISGAPRESDSSRSAAGLRRGAEPLRRRSGPFLLKAKPAGPGAGLGVRPLRIARVARRACADATGSRAVGFTQGPGAGAPAVGSPSSRPRGRGRP